MALVSNSRFRIAIVTMCSVTFLILTINALMHGRDRGNIYQKRDPVLPPCSADVGVIPKRFHQMWKNSTVPQEWLALQSKCRKLNADYEYFLWTHDQMDYFIEENYPWFLTTYNSYPYRIQKVDAARYFILYHFGGVYIDLDLECLLSFNHIIQNASQANIHLPTSSPTAQLASRHEIILASTSPFGVTNAMLMTPRCSPFFRSLLGRLPAHNHNYVLPYFTVIFSTGPMFLTRSIDAYPQAKSHIYKYSDFEYHHVLFKHGVGNTWHRWDGWIIRHVNHRWVYITALVLTLLITIVVIFRKRRESSPYVVISAKSAIA